MYSKSGKSVSTELIYTFFFFPHLILLSYKADSRIASLKSLRKLYAPVNTEGWSYQYYLQTSGKYFFHLSSTHTTVSGTLCPSSYAQDDICCSMTAKSVDLSNLAAGSP